MPRLGGHEISIERLQECQLRHRIEFPDTDVFEKAAADVIAADFPIEGSLRLLRQVCRWGGYYGIAARVVKHNDPATIAAAFRTAYQHSRALEPDHALEELNRLRSLGRPSFASKVLRFLDPENAAILDSVVSTELQFPASPVGYADLIGQCRRVVAELSADGVPNRARAHGLWYVADVEAAFYADAREL
jgi:hypothetical protein